MHGRSGPQRLLGDILFDCILGDDQRRAVYKRTAREAIPMSFLLARKATDSLRCPAAHGTILETQRRRLATSSIP
jgi:hypothetical protein